MERSAEDDEEDRLSILRQSFWERLTSHSAELDALHDALVATGFLDYPSLKQLRAIVFLLPPDLIELVGREGLRQGAAVKGLDRFVRENLAAIQAVL